MVLTRRGSTSDGGAGRGAGRGRGGRGDGHDGAGADTSSSSGEMDFHQTIAEEVREALRETLPGLFHQMKTELKEELKAEIKAEIMEAVEEKFTSRTSLVGGSSRIVSIRDFNACSPPTYDGNKDPAVSMRWISGVEGAFRTCSCPPELKVTYAVNLLRRSAKDWWDLATKDMTDAELDAITWDGFKAEFRKHFVPQVEVERLTREFLTLAQTTESVNQITDKFYELANFCGSYVQTEDQKMQRYCQVLRTEIREFVMMGRHSTLKELVESARARELELEAQKRLKRPASQPQDLFQSDKRIKPTGGRRDGKSAHRCTDCGKRHEGRCVPRTGSGSGSRFGDGCYKCGELGHYGRDCPTVDLLCFGCNQYGHIRTNCPNRRADDFVRNPSPATLRITDGRDSRMETPTTRGRGFQMITADADADPEMMTGLFNVYFCNC